MNNVCSFQLQNLDTEKCEFHSIFRAYQRRPMNRGDGNVRRLTDMRDDDDENATWNGNSTQQM